MVVSSAGIHDKGGNDMADSEKLDLILSAIQGMKDDIRELKDDVQGLKNDVQGLKEDVQTLKEDVQGLKEDVQTLKEDVQELKERMSTVEEKVTNLDMVLENEIRVNIQRVAEGHLDLSRNLHEALKINNEKEMLVIRVNVLETEMRKVKARLEIA